MLSRVDRPLLFITLALLLGGLLIVSSASVVISQKNFSTPYYYLLRQSLAALVGIAAALATQAIPYKAWKKLSPFLLLASLILVAVVLIPDTDFGLSFGGASRWLKIGPLNFQPSELLKISLILYLASWLEKKRGRVHGFTSAFMPFIVVMSVVGVFLVLQRDIGTLIVVSASAIILYFLGGGRASQMAAIVVLSVAALFVLIQIAPYRVNRFLVFLNPGLDPQGIGYHISQAKIAIGTGGFWGRGFGQSIQKYNYLPEPTGDSIFAVIVEEFGLLGSLVLVIAFVVFFLRAMTIARRAPAFVNMAAISGFLPLTGIPLPFISYGGTALVVNLAMVGIILNVSKHCKIFGF
ncbi:MAG: cell division protein FtsW [Candidatus Sungbacteria bacterium]|nr:cell division protein FtsW [Candidatus Sungbacteria bacterium]